jgi:tetratricopeptide (TPR) repeat protein
MRWVCPALLLSACSPVVPALRPRAEQIKPVVAQNPLAAALALAINGGSEEVRAAAWEQAGRAYIQLAVAEASAFAQRRAQQDAIGALEHALLEAPRSPYYAQRLYWLGHAYQVAVERTAAQAAWRALVCANHYTYPHSGFTANSLNSDLRPKLQPAPWPTGATLDERLRVLQGKGPSGQVPAYQDIYPVDCTEFGHAAGAMAVVPGQLAEVWTRIGDWHRYELDPYREAAADEVHSPWGLTRAASAYRHALSYPNTRNRKSTLYTYAGILHAQQRDTLAVKAYAELLDLAMPSPPVVATGKAAQEVEYVEDAGAGLALALMAVAASEPREDAPYLELPRYEDVEVHLERVEQAYRVGLTRLQDAAIVPPSKPWAPQVYAQLANAYIERDMYNNASATYEALLSAYPLSHLVPRARQLRAETMRYAAYRHKSPGAVTDSTPILPMVPLQPMALDWSPMPAIEPIASGQRAALRTSVEYGKPFWVGATRAACETPGAALNCGPLDLEVPREVEVALLVARQALEACAVRHPALPAQASTWGKVHLKFGACDKPVAVVATAHTTAPAALDTCIAQTLSSSLSGFLQAYRRDIEFSVHLIPSE